jgi:hypothetical protein
MILQVSKPGFFGFKADLHRQTTLTLDNVRFEFQTLQMLPGNRVSGCDYQSRPSQLVELGISLS